MSEAITFRVLGIPKPKGSMKGFAFHRKNGKLGVALTHDNSKTKAWSSDLTEVAQRYAPAEGPWDGPIFLCVGFILPAPKYVQKLIAKGKTVPATKKPDLDKLLRTLKDALKGVMYQDDAQVIRAEMYKQYATQYSAPGAMVELRKVES